MWPYVYYKSAIRQMEDCDWSSVAAVTNLRGFVITLLPTLAIEVQMERRDW